MSTTVEDADIREMDDALADLQELDFDFVTEASEDNIWCEQCKSLKQELEKLRQDHALNYNTLKKKIISTDLLIKKYKAKCEDHEMQTKKMEDMSKKLEQTQRESETLRAQLGSAMQQIEPVKKAKQALETDNQMKMTEIQSLQDKLTAAVTVKKQYENLAKSTSDYKELYDEEKKAHAKKIRELEASCNKQETQLGKYKDECKSLKSDQINTLKKQRKLEDRLKKTVERMDRYWCILKDNGLLPKGEKKLRTDTYLDLSELQDQACSQDESPIEDSLEYGSLVEKKSCCYGDNENADDYDDMMTWTFSPMVNLLSPLPPSPMPLRENHTQENQDTKSNDENDESDADDEFATQLEAELLESSKMGSKGDELIQHTNVNRHGRQLIRQSATVEEKNRINITLADTRNQNSSKGFSLSDSVEVRNETMVDSASKSVSTVDTAVDLQLKSPVMDDFKENIICVFNEEQDLLKTSDVVADKKHFMISSQSVKYCHGNKVCDDNCIKESHSSPCENNNKEMSEISQLMTSFDKETDTKVISSEKTTNLQDKTPSNQNAQNTTDLQTLDVTKIERCNVDKRLSPLITNVDILKQTDEKKIEMSPGRRLTRSSSTPLRTSPRGSYSQSIKSRRGSEKLVAESLDSDSSFTDQQDSSKVFGFDGKNVEENVKGLSAKLEDCAMEKIIKSQKTVSVLTKDDSAGLFLRSNTRTKLPTSGVRSKLGKSNIQSLDLTPNFTNEKDTESNAENICTGVGSELYQNDSSKSDAIGSPRPFTRAMSRQVSTGFALKSTHCKSTVPSFSASQLDDNVNSKKDRKLKDSAESKDSEHKKHPSKAKCIHTFFSNRNLVKTEESSDKDSPGKNNKKENCLTLETFPVKKELSGIQIGCRNQTNLLQCVQKINSSSHVKQSSAITHPKKDVSLPVNTLSKLSIIDTNPQQNIASSTVVSPEIVDLTEGKATWNNPSTPTIRSSNSSVMASSSPVSPLPPSPFDFFIPVAISPLPPSPMRNAEPQSPLSRSPLKEEEEDDAFYNDDESTPKARLVSSVMISPLTDNSGGSTPVQSPVPTFVSPLVSAPGSLCKPFPITRNEDYESNTNPCSFHAEVPSGAIPVKPKSSTSCRSLQICFVKGETQSGKHSLMSLKAAEDSGSSTSLKRKSSEKVEDLGPKDKVACLGSTANIADQISIKTEGTRVNIADQTSVNGSIAGRTSVKTEGIPLWKVIDMHLKGYLDTPQNDSIETVAKDMLQLLLSKDTDFHHGCVMPVYIQWVVQRLRCNQLESVMLLQPCWDKGKKEIPGTDTWMPLLTQDETRLLLLTASLMQQDQWNGLYQKLLESLWNAVFLSDIIPTTGVTSLCRMITGLCRLYGDVEQVRVLFYNIITRSNLPSLFLAGAVAGVWPQALDRATGESSVVRVIEHVVTKQLLPGKPVHEKLLCCLTELCQWSRITLESKTLLKQCLKQLDEEARRESSRKSLLFDLEKALEMLLHFETLDFFKAMFMQCGLNQVTQSFTSDNWSKKNKADRMNPEYVKAIVRLTGFAIIQKNDITTKYVNTQVKKHLQKILNTRNASLDVQTCVIEVLLELSFLTPGNILHIIKGWCNSHQSQIPLSLHQRLCWTRDKLVTKFPGLHCPEFS